MQYRQLGRSGIKVSSLCLGTMTFGEQNSEAEAHAQLDYALAQGINFIDTAEMYAVPARAETYTRTESIIGTWLAQRTDQRDQIIVATKVIGPGGRFEYVRDGRPRLDRKNIAAAVEGSLQRLQTDYIDLYQLHWPERTTNYFGALDYQHVENEDAIALEGTLAVLADLVAAGKIRTIGVSNETPWGVMRYLHLAELNNWPRMVSIQNPYSLINRTFEVGLAEVAIREDCGLLAYGALASGMLTGKYLQGAKPKGARLTRWPQYFPRYLSKGSIAATEQYAHLAQQYGLQPAAMAIQWAMQRRFMTSVILGATSLEQLAVLVEAAELELAPELLEEIDAIHKRQPNAYLIT